VDGRAVVEGIGKGDGLMVTTLINVVRDLESLPGEATICAAKPWSEISRALIVAEADDWGMSPEAHSLGMAYFLEVFIARDFLEGWTRNSATEPTLQAKCARLIRYAVDDA
jgi:hypothetical protein